MRAGRATLHQLEGVAAQVLMGAPSLLASFVIARFSAVALVADLAIAFGLASAVFTAASFNLSHSLALWGRLGYTDEDFWVNRTVGSLVAVVVALALLLGMGLAWRIVLLALVVKLADAAADLRFGLDLAHVGNERAIRRLLLWSAARCAWLVAAAGGMVLGGMDGVQALLLAAAVHAAVVLSTSDRQVLTPITRPRLAAAWRIAEHAAPLSVAATACGLLVTTPRLLSKHVVPPDQVGYYGITFMGVTFIGMAFNVVWFRLAASTRRDGPGAAVRLFFREGTLLALLLAAGMWIAAPVAAWIYGIDDPAFRRTLITVGSCFVLFYFVLCLANLLKMSRFRLLEATAYVTTAAALAAVALGAHGLLAGILAGATVLAVFVSLGLRAITRAELAS